MFVGILSIFWVIEPYVFPIITVYVNKVFNGTAKIDEAVRVADEAFDGSFNLKTAIKKANQNFNEIQKN